MTDLTPIRPSSEERTLALVSHAMSFVEGGVLAPLLMYVMREPIHDAVYKDKPGRDSAFVAFHSLQSLYFGLIFLAVSLPLALLTCGASLFITIPIYFVFEVIACLKAHEGVWYHLPIAGGLAADKHPPPPGAAR